MAAGCESRAPAAPGPSAWAVLAATVLLAMTSLVGGFLHTAWRLSLDEPVSAAFSGLLTLMTLVAAPAVGELLVLCLRGLLPVASPESAPALSDPGELPTVCVLLPIRNEPAEVVERSIVAACGLDYPSGRLSILVVDNSDLEDDGSVLPSNLVVLRERLAHHPSVRRFERRQGPAALRTLFRNSLEGFKAGNLNLGYGITDAEYVLQLDADSVVRPETLRSVMPRFAAPADRDRPRR